MRRRSGLFSIGVQMLPELAAVHVSGLIPTLAMTTWQLYSDRRKRSTSQMRFLQDNLASLNLYWSESQSEIKRRAVDSEQADRAAYKRSILTLGIFCLPLSWIGFFLQLLVYFSSTWLAVPRMEKVLFNSVLISKRLPSEKTREVLMSIQNTVMNIKIPFEEPPV